MESGKESVMTLVTSSTEDPVGSDSRSAWKTSMRDAAT